jgi:hypothetical protein
MSTERSGSNLLTSLAGALPGISAPPPTHLFRLFLSNLRNYGDLSNDLNWRTLIEDVVENFDAKLGLWHSAVDADSLMVAATDRNVLGLLRMIYAQEAQSDDAAHSFVKENHTHSFALTLLEYFADCRFVHLVRDPRDVASSWVNAESIPGGVEKATQTWIEDQTGTETIRRSLRPAGRLLRLRYEDLVSQPVPQLTALADFMGVPFHDSALDFYTRPRTIENAERIRAWENIKRPIMRNNMGAYAQTLTTEDIRYIELRCRDLMQEFGYVARSASGTSKRDEGEEIESLTPRLSRGRYSTQDTDEAAIRLRRLAAIRRVLERRLP